MAIVFKKQKIILDCKNPIPFPNKKENEFLENSIFNNQQKKVLKKAFDENILMKDLMYKEYSADKMEVILEGLREGIKLSEYINPLLYNSNQLKEILYGIKQGIDINKYCNEKIDFKIMKKIRIGLSNGIDLSSYIKYKEELIDEIYVYIENGLDIEKYLYDYNLDQLKEIRKGFLNNIEVDIYTSNEYSAEHMKYIRLGLENNIDVSSYTDPMLKIDYVKTLFEELLKKEGIL